MSKRYVGLFGKNIGFLISGYNCSVLNLQTILDSGEVYEHLTGASLYEVQQLFENVWYAWKNVYENKSYIKANIIKKILFEITEYVHNNDKEKQYLISCIDEEKLKDY